MVLQVVTRVKQALTWIKLGHATDALKESSATSPASWRPSSLSQAGTALRSEARRSMNAVQRAPALEATAVTDPSPTTGELIIVCVCSWCVFDDDH